MIRPLSNRPKITQFDIDNGFVNRYFAQHISTKKIVEIDEAQYNLFRRVPLYETTALKWIIGGNDIDMVVGGHIVRGTQYKNQQIIQYYNQKMPGLDKVLPAPLEYFKGNKITPLQLEQYVDPIIQYDTEIPEEEPAAPAVPVWTDIAHDTFTDTDAVLVQNHTPTLGFAGWVQATSSGGNIRIQSNRARQTSAPFGGRRHFVTTSDITSDAFKFFADIYPSSGGTEIGILFRNNGSVTQAVNGGQMEGVELATTSVSGTGGSITVRLAMRFFISGSQQADFWSNEGVPIPNYTPSGSRFEVTVSGSTADISIMPAGGGTPYFIEQGITLPSPVLNDTGHQRFGFRYGSSAIAREYDNFTVQTLI